MAMIVTAARITGCRAVPYDLPFARPWRTAHGTMERRRGWTILLETDADVTGLGECAPMPEAGTERPGEAEAALSTWLDRAVGLDLDALWEAVDREPPPASVRCALEGAIADACASIAGVPLARLIDPDAPLVIGVNASVGAADDDLGRRARAALEAGFRVLKVKVGAGPAQDEMALLRALASGLPTDASLRIDANGAWDQKAAFECLRALSGLPVESVEEPLAGADPELLGRMQDAVPFPLALDESLPRYLAEGRLAGLPVRRVVIKPTVLGGIRPCRRLVAGTRAEAVFTTTLEAAPGRWLVAHLAAAMGSDCPHGLDTGRWFADDVGEGPPVAAGRCRLTGMEPGRAD
jgi:o-succinylbenzoate synthase